TLHSFGNAQMNPTPLMVRTAETAGCILKSVEACRRSIWNLQSAICNPRWPLKERAVRIAGRRLKPDDGVHRHSICNLQSAICNLIVLAAIGCAPGPQVKVGSKAFTEGVILGELATRLAETSGVRVEHKEQLGGTQILWQALESGEIDAYPEY